MSDTIFTYKSDLPGPVVAIFSGIHGNELAGISVVRYFRENLNLKRGTVHLVCANAKAIEKNVRFVEKNLNRCFKESSLQGNTHEEALAVELMQLLDSCDALLDLHAYNEPNGDAVPFIIADSNAKDVIQSFEAAFVIEDVDKIEKGSTNGYMTNQGKVGVCVELGSINEPDKYIDLGIKTVKQFLSYFDMIDDQVSLVMYPKTTLKADGKYVRKNDEFFYTKRFKTFEKVTKGQHICTDGEVKVFAEKDSLLLFPSGNKPVGVEAYIIAVASQFSRVSSM